jgi:pseudouridine synthase
MPNKPAANSIKLQAFIAQHGLASRRKAEALIDQGVVTVNGVVAHIGQRINPYQDKVNVGGKTLPTDQKTDLVYFLVNKPVGYVSTTHDEHGRRTVLDLLPKGITTKYRLFPVGRLDIESQGLILLTNDGELTQQLTHPSFRHKKTYHVQVAGIPSDKALEHLQRGVKLKEGYTKPDHLEILEHDHQSTWLEITIHEGRNHQVRRMMERIGYPVIKLVRIRMGPLNLEMVENGRYIELLDRDIAKFFPSRK